MTIRPTIHYTKRPQERPQVTCSGQPGVAHAAPETGDFAFYGPEIDMKPPRVEPSQTAQAESSWHPVVASTKGAQAK